MAELLYSPSPSYIEIPRSADFSGDIFESDAGIQTGVTFTSIPHSMEINFSYQNMTPTEFRAFNQFWIDHRGNNGLTFDINWDNFSQVILDPDTKGMILDSNPVRPGYRFKSFIRHKIRLSRMVSLDFTVVSIPTVGTL